MSKTEVTHTGTLSVTMDFTPDRAFNRGMEELSNRVRSFDLLEFHMEVVQEEGGQVYEYEIKAEVID